MPRILVVEDDPDQLEIRKRILENADYEVVTAENASEALERWSDCPVVVMDLRIPTREDGLQLIQAIDRKARIIVLSGGPMDPAPPVEEFLMKPCPPRKLLAAIDKWASSTA